MLPKIQATYKSTYTSLTSCSTTNGYLFLHSIQTAYKLLELFQKLKDLGHPLYTTDSMATIPCSMAKVKVDAQVQLSQQRLGAWTQEVADLRTRCHWLLYLNMPKLLQLYHFLHLQGAADTSRVDNIVHEVSFLCPNTDMERKKLRARVVCLYISHVIYS